MVVFKNYAQKYDLAVRSINCYNLFAGMFGNKEQTFLDSKKGKK
jgi:hypothetical protein